ncbi:MAG TPA: YqaJ viral recombinase family protein [Candidatus Saccharibacteria bacterium]|nr:YqaJ viral recombinase family protein [Candidatus Saccharibacteria bacterium]
MKTATELDLEQGSLEWKLARLGIPTGSEFKNVLAKNKGNTEASTRRNYRAQLVIERLTGQEVERYKSKAMEWGNDTEDLAALTYSLRTGNKVRKCGFFKHKKIDAGVSPDRIIIDKNGCVEIKCYEIANHIQALRNNAMPKEHYPQVQAEILFTDSDFCDFVSYAPELPPNAQIFIQRIERDDDFINNILLPELNKFISEVNEECEFVKNYGS